MKTIVITGASGGIGSEITSILAKNHNRLILVYNSNKQSIVNLEQKFFNKCEVHIYKCDLKNAASVTKFANTIISKFNTIDALINCAGVSKFQQIQDTTEQDYLDIMDTNLKSVVLLTSLLSKNMISNKSGKIVNISSIWGKVGSSMESLYSASKGAINALTLSLAKELGPSNICVNAICPGLIDTKMNDNINADSISDFVENTPLRRIGKPKDVANLVEFLISDKANFITGQLINVDGGFSV